MQAVDWGLIPSRHVAASERKRDRDRPRHGDDIHASGIFSSIWCGLVFVVRRVVLMNVSMISPRVRTSIQRKRRKLVLGCLAHSWDLLKLGFAVAQSTIAKYISKRGDLSDQSWGTFPRNHMPCSAPRICSPSASTCSKFWLFRDWTGESFSGFSPDGRMDRAANC